MFKNNRAHFFKGAIIAMASFLLLIGCEEPNEGLGFSQIIGNNIPADSMVIPIITYTEPVDSVILAAPYNEQLAIFGGYTGNRLVGSYQSPLFGEAQAAIVAEVLPSVLNVDFGPNPQVDSVRLFLRVSGAYGDTTQAVNFEVKELISPLSKDTTFFSSYQPEEGQVLGRLDNAIIKPNGQSRRDSLDLPAALEIPLDSAYFQQRFAELANGSATEFSSFSSFLEYFNGLVIRTTQAECITYVNLNSTLSSLQIYYHNDDEADLRAGFDFLQNKSVVPITFSIFDQDYRTAQMDFTQQDTVNGEQQTLLQSMGGLATMLKIRNARFDSLIKQGAVINRAFLTLSMDATAGDPFPPNDALEVRKLTANGPGDRILDFQVSFRGDGQLQEGRFRNGIYRLELTRHLLEVIGNQRNPTLAVVPVVKSTLANRTVLRGSSDDLVKTRLVIYYTQP